MKKQLEVERKFTVPDGFAMSTVEAPEGFSLEPDTELDLESTYFDTADLRLAAHGITLRRRTGGKDDGWHLKLPAADDAREEIHRPIRKGETRPPEALARLVRAHVRNEALVPVVRLRTRRVVHELVPDTGPDRDGERQVLAEVTDDHVTAEVLGDEVTISTWRELEVELADGDREVLEAAEAVLEEAGARRSHEPSKFLHALGDRVLRRGEPADDGSAGAVVLGFLREQVDALIANDPGVRTDAEDAVHQMRVATRRLRSALRTFRPLLDTDRTEPIREELRWLGVVLGDARDAEVLRDRLLDMLADAPAGAGRETATERVSRELGKRYEHAHREAVRALDSARYLRLLDDLDALLADPPFTERAAGKAGKVLPRLAGKAYRTVRRHHDAVEAAGTEHERDLALHEVRKKAKRARYAGEALEKVSGKAAKRFAEAMEEVQDVLGGHQDGVVAAETLTTLAAQAHAAGEDTFHYGRLAGLEVERAAEAKRAYGRAWSAASKKKLRAWTR